MKEEISKYSPPPIGFWPRAVKTTRHQDTQKARSFDYGKIKKIIFWPVHPTIKNRLWIFVRLCAKSAKGIRTMPLTFRFLIEKRYVFLGFIFLLTGCAPLRYSPMESREQATPQEAIQNAENFLKTRPNWEIDCSHFVLACYHSPEMNRFFGKYSYLNHNLTKDLRIYLEQKKTRRARAADIQPGDILVFNKTYDKNHDGHIDEKDTDTHVGIVESFNDWMVTYIDASESRKPPRIHRRKFSFYPKKPGDNETVATDLATGTKIHARDTFYAAYGAPKD
jgi:hypothetical protein